MEHALNAQPCGLTFLTELDKLSFGEPGRLDDAAFVDEFDLPKRPEDSRGSAPDCAVITGNRLWMIELKTERGSHRVDQIPAYLTLGQHRHPDKRIDLTYLTGPLSAVPPAPVMDTRFVHLTWSDVLPLIRSSWADGTAQQRRLVAQLEEVLTSLDMPWGPWREKRLGPADSPGRVVQADPIQEAMRLAEQTAEDHGQRALDHRAADLADLKELRQLVAERINRSERAELQQVKPWLWSHARSGGHPLTDAGELVGYELRLSWYELIP